MDSIRLLQLPCLILPPPPREQREALQQQWLVQRSEAFQISKDTIAAAQARHAFDFDKSRQLPRFKAGKEVMDPSCSISHKISKSDSSGGEPAICDSAQHTAWVA